MLVGLMAAVAGADAPGPAVITNPHWLERPVGDDIARAYPDRAQRMLVSGGAELACQVAPDGRLDRCRVYVEAPVGLGFGAAALSLAPKFRMEPSAQPLPGVEPSIFIPIRFVIIGGRPLDRQTVMQAPRWVSAPSFEDLGRSFPPTATADGDVTLRCDVSSEGGLGLCVVRDERPGGQGFRKAVWPLVSRFRVDIAGRLARPGDNLAVDVKIHFRNPKSPDFMERRISQPTWLVVADPDHAAQLFPVAASAKGVKTGRGVASCAVAADGSLQDCVALPGDPDGLGFSEAAVKIASVMRMNPWTDAGGPVDGAHVQGPVRFDLSAAKP